MTKIKIDPFDADIRRTVYGTYQVTIKGERAWETTNRTRAEGVYEFLTSGNGSLPLDEVAA